VLFNEEPPLVRLIYKFGALAIVADRRNTIRNKLDDRGLVCLYLGPAKDHSNDCYRFLNVKTKFSILVLLRIIQTIATVS
jgi:hypothetical protein